MKTLFSYLTLPKEVTDFERRYLARMNKIGFWFFAVHPLVFMVVAALCGTGVLAALGFGMLLLVGPFIAWKTFEHPRSVSLAYGFTAMCMGGLLVHFGQGPMQIEMHFYFFVLLALLAVYANPAVIVVAAVTAAVHHLLLWLFIPTSIFNYDASIWTVVVHAIFVVLESVAACFVARSFFDDVIGLDKIVSARTAQLKERNAAMRLVLDNVSQGLMTIDCQARVKGERSRRVSDFLGSAGEAESWLDVLQSIDPGARAAFEINWQILLEDFMPREVALENLASELEVDGRMLDISYQVLSGDDGALQGALVVLTDVTEARARERAEAEQKETMEVFHRILRDKKGFMEFFEETGRIVRAIGSRREGLEATRRLLHTVKGNAALFGASSVATCAHALEDVLAESGEGLTEAEADRLVQAWSRFGAKLSAFLDDKAMERIELETHELDRALRLGMQNRPGTELATLMLGWKMEPTRHRLERLAEQARALGKRYNRAIEVEIDDRELRIEPRRWGAFWGATVHALRNAMDHGLEPADERVELGKPAAGRLVLRTRPEGDFILVEVEDDGRGIDWDRVRRKAEAAGMPHERREDLVAAMMSSGLSTKEQVSELSGRGVGMDALKRATESLEGTIEIESTEGQGSVVRMRIPQDRIYASADLRLAGTTGFELPPPSAA